jgi:hypothetical protein
LGEADGSILRGAEAQEDIYGLTESLRLATRRSIELGDRIFDANGQVARLQVRLGETDAERAILAKEIEDFRAMLEA